MHTLIVEHAIVIAKLVRKGLVDQQLSNCSVEHSQTHLIVTVSIEIIRVVRDSECTCNVSFSH